MYKMIIVDDEPQIRKGLSKSFPWTQVGFTVIDTFENGLEAINYLTLDTTDIQLILCDIKMPIMNGLQLAEYVHKNMPNITMVFLSAYEDFNYAKDALRFGVKRYIVKPTKYNELLITFDELREELDQKAMQRDETPSTYYDNIIHEVNDYILNDLSNANLEQAAEIVHMSTHYLSKLYSQHTGLTFSTFLLNKRMEKAAELLVDYRYKTYEISDILGYNNPKNFTRSFKKHFGITPREFRMKGIDYEHKN